jgi:hypothetical protein
MRVISLLTAVFLGSAPVLAQSEPEPLGIALEGYPYPFPVRFLPLTVERHAVRLAYMDVPPGAAPSGRTVLLMHGRNPGLLLGADHQGLDRGGLSRAGAGPDQLRRILQA